MRNSLRILSVVIGCLIAFAGCTTGGSDAETGAGTITESAQPETQTEPRPVPEDSSMKVVAYFIQWGVYARNYLVSDIPWDSVTHVNYAFAKIVNGYVTSADPFADFQKAFGNEPQGAPYKGNFYQLAELKREHPHLKTLISIGGWTLSDGFSTAAATPEGRLRFADSAVAFMRRYGFDGVDLDWEYPVEGGIAADRSPDDTENFTLLLRDLRIALDAAGDEDGVRYLLTGAVTAGVDKISNLDVPGLNRYMDWINVMTYDFHVGGPGTATHHAPLFANPDAPADSEHGASYYADAAVRAYLDAEMPASKIVLGVPFYGRGWQGFSDGGGLYAQAAGAAQSGTWENGVFDYDDLVQNYIAPDGSNVFWDDAAKAAYLWDADAGLFISYENPRSLGIKMDYILEHGLGGAMYWELSQDRGLELVRLIADRLLGD